MDDMSITIDKGESINIYAYQKIAGRNELLQIFIWNNKENEISCSVGNGNTDVVSMEIVKGETFIETAHDIDIIGKDKHGITKAEIKYR